VLSFVIALLETRDEQRAVSGSGPAPAGDMHWPSLLCCQPAQMQTVAKAGLRGVVEIATCASAGWLMTAGDRGGCSQTNCNRKCI